MKCWGRLHGGASWRSGGELYWFLTPAVSFCRGSYGGLQVGLDFLKLELYFWLDGGGSEHTSEADRGDAGRGGA